jgi:hypothetical protein
MITMTPETFFAGIPNLRDSRSSVDLEVWQLEELEKCSADPIYFIEKYIKINSLDEGIVPMILRDYQRDLVNKFAKYRFNIVKFPRQSGKSATTRGYLLWYAIFNPGKVVAILANKLRSSQEQMLQLRESYIQLPLWMQPGVSAWNKQSIQMGNGSRIMCAPTSVDGIRGMSVNCMDVNTRVTVRDKISLDSTMKSIADIALSLDEDTSELVSHKADFNGNVLFFKNTKYEILTPDGYKDFDGVMLGKNKTITIELFGGQKYTVTENHLIKSRSGEFIHAKELKKGSMVCMGNQTLGTVKKVTQNHEETEVGDFLDIKDNHQYIAEGGLVSHQCLYIDEMAFLKPHMAEEFMASVFPVLSSGKTTQLLITSTPNGMNHFYTLWEKSYYEDEIPKEKRRGFQSFVKSEITYKVVPGRDEEWAEAERRRLGPLKFRQEYECMFLGSAATLIGPMTLAKLQPVPELHIPGMPPSIHIYEHPIRDIRELEYKEWEYVASIDTGYGYSQDFSVLQIFLCKSNIEAIQVLTFASNDMDEEEFCQYANALLSRYHNPYLIIEMNGPGQATMQYFRKHEYENLVHFTPPVHGLWATKKTKQAACVLLKTYTERNLLTIRDKDTIDELANFGKTTVDTFGAMSGGHDDFVTSMYWIPYYLNSPKFYGNQIDLKDEKVQQVLSSVFHPEKKPRAGSREEFDELVYDLTTEAIDPDIPDIEPEPELTEFFTSLLKTPKGYSVEKRMNNEAGESRVKMKSSDNTFQDILKYAEQSLQRTHFTAPVA